METLLAGRGVELQVETELNDHETIRLMVQQGVGASILPHSSVCRECARGLVEAHRITAGGVFRTLALGVAANRGASSARDAVAEIVTQVLAEIEAEGRLRLRSRSTPRAVRPARASSLTLEEERDADRRFTDPSLGKRPDVAAAPADPDL